MEETILFPSPNWFCSSVMKATPDGWVVYGGPSKSLCVLEPLPTESPTIIQNKSGYRSHFIAKAHFEKITCVDVSPEWPTKRNILTGSADGTVKQWNLAIQDHHLQAKGTHAHEVHKNEKEEIIGVGYSNEIYAITVGVNGTIVKWDLNANVVQKYNTILKTMKPLCMSCSPHIAHNVAIGTKQGLILVVDLSDKGRILYKVRAHDDEILNLSWCPQYEVKMRKALGFVTESVSARMDRIRNEPEPELSISKLEEEAEAAFKCSAQPDKVENTANQSTKEDSSDEIEVVEEDLFGMYKDHAPNEFGHKKFEAEDVIVKVKKDEDSGNDFLAECLKLKSKILQRKATSEVSIENLVDAMDKAHVSSENKEVKDAESPAWDEEAPNQSQTCSEKTKENESEIDKETPKGKNAAVAHSSVHIHRHLLATVGKQGMVKIWSKSGKQVSSCLVPNYTLSAGKNKHRINGAMTVLWYKPEVLLIVDAKSTLLEANPFAISSKGKLEHSPVHSLHRRGLYCVTSSAPRVQDGTSDDDWPVWTAAQDRFVVQYSLRDRCAVTNNQTCAGFVYTVQPCPYDAKKVAVSVGDGAIRVWDADTADDGDTRLQPGSVSSYWQNVQGKVLSVAWHPNKENLLAFSTAESRIGFLNTGGPGEKAAKLLATPGGGSVYAVSWDERTNLYGCADGALFVCRADKPDDAPVVIDVTLEGKSWHVTEVRWYERALVVGSAEGGVALLSSTCPHSVIAAAFPFATIVFSVDWHPQQVSESSEDSPLKDLIATCAHENKQPDIVILQVSEDEAGGIKVCTWKTLRGHKAALLRVAWNPHRDGVLLSTSQDCTVRVWDVVAGECTAVFGGHYASTMGAAWCTRPTMADYVLSGAADCTMRLWSVRDHPASAFVDRKLDSHTSRKATRVKNKAKAKGEAKEVVAPDSDSDGSDDAGRNVADKYSGRPKASKRFILSMCQKQINSHGLQGCKLLLRKYLQKNGLSLAAADEEEVELDETGCDFVKMFGSMNEINQLIEQEAERHLYSSNEESWIMMTLFRGEVDKIFQFASQRNIICPYLLSIAPCVSYKYWKDATQLYLTQIDRLVAKGEEEKLYACRHYGGAVYRKVGLLLSVHDVTGAVRTLTEAKLYKEAYLLCRLRYMDSIAEEILRAWSHEKGSMTITAMCNLALGDLQSAAAALARSIHEEHLNLAADIAKVGGQKMYAEQIVERKDKIKSLDTAAEVAVELEKLPTRFERLMADGRTEIENDLNESPSECKDKITMPGDKLEKLPLLEENKASVDNDDPKAAGESSSDCDIASAKKATEELDKDYNVIIMD